MAAAIRLRDDFDGPGLRELAKRSRNGSQSRRLLALAEIYDGGRRRLELVASGFRSFETGCCGSPQTEVPVLAPLHVQFERRTSPFFR